MDYLKFLFKQTESVKQAKPVKEEKFQLSPNFQSPMKVIEEQLNILESINLSPIPQTSQDKDIYYRDIKKSLMKLIFFIDIVLMEKLKLSKADISPKNNTQSEHYWKIITKHYSNLDTVKFINNIKTEINDTSEKSLTFLTLVIIEKLFGRFLKQFYNENFDK